MQRAIGQTVARKSLHKGGSVAQQHQRHPHIATGHASTKRAQVHFCHLCRGDLPAVSSSSPPQRLLSDPQSKARPPPSKLSFASTQQHSQDSIDCCTAFCSECLVTRSRTTSSFRFVSLFRAWSWVTIVISHPFTCHREESTRTGEQAFSGCLQALQAKTASQDFSTESNQWPLKPGILSLAAAKCLRSSPTKYECYSSHSPSSPPLPQQHEAFRDILLLCAEVLFR